MSILQPDEIRSLRSMTATTAHTWGKVDLHKIGKDLYELLTYPGRRSFKQRARTQTVELKPDKRYTPSQVSTARCHLASVTKKSRVAFLFSVITRLVAWYINAL